MPRTDSTGQSIPWATIVAVLAATTGAIFYFTSLESSRRPAPAQVPLEVLGYQDADARLWQDPFQAAAKREAEMQKLAAAGNPATAPHSVPEQSGNRGEPAWWTAMLRASGLARATVGEKVNVDWRHQPAALQEQIANELNERDEKKERKRILVIPVLIPGAAYGELAEQRVRNRIAVLEGLAAMGYQSRSGEHVGYLKLDWPSKFYRDPEGKCTFAPPGIESHDENILVPYEWLDHASVQIAGRRPFSRLSHKTYGSVLVLWCPEEAFLDLPLSRLARLIKIVFGKDEPGVPDPCGAERRIDFHVLGPTVSTTLHALVNEADKPCKDTKAALSHVRMYLSTATADDRILLFGLDEAEEDEPDMLGQFIKSRMEVCRQGTQVIAADGQDVKDGFRLFRLTPTDHQMAAEMVKELERRGIRLRARLGDKPDQVAVVAELDTYYGRALPFSFAAALTGEDATGLMREPRRFPQWVHPFVYLRGIDGKVIGEASPASISERDKSPGERWSGFKLETPSEPPEGLNQSDYLRRLAERLAALDSSLRAETGNGLKAVGVLGTDVYDKLLVLRALRDRLPDVIFFTTSVDARYMAPEEWGATHNLLIAAPFGLRLHEYYQRAIPPFRDSYQTALFYATQVAITPNLPDDRPRYANPAPLLKLGAVRLFEVGRSGIYDLSVDDQNAIKPDPTVYVNDQDYEGELAGPPATVQPYREDMALWPHRWVPVVLIIVSILILLALPAWAHYPLKVTGIRASMTSWWNEPKPYPRMKAALRGRALNTRLFIVLAIIVVTLVIAILMHLEGQQGAPNAWLDRVNVWPTEAIRLFTSLLCVHLIIKSLAARMENDQSIQSAFKLWGLTDPEKADSKERPPYIKPAEVEPRIRLDPWAVVGDSNRQPVAESKGGSKRDDTYVYAQNLWWEYQRRGGWKQRFLRSGIMAAVFWVFAFALYSLLGSSTHPMRGQLAETVDELFLALSVWMFLFLVFFVLDATLLNRRFIDYLTTTDTYYPDGAFEQFRRFGLPYYDLTEYADIRLIAERTRVVGEIVYYPFLVFFLVVAGRSAIFADWKWPAALLIVLSLCLAMALLGTLQLRRAADRARADAIRRLRERLVRSNAAGDQNTARGIEELIDIVRNEKEGAFSLLSQHPFVAAILLPSGGIGLWALLEYIAHMAGS